MRSFLQIQRSRKSGRWKGRCIRRITREIVSNPADLRTFKHYIDVAGSNSNGKTLTCAKGHGFIVGQVKDFI